MPVRPSEVRGGLLTPWHNAPGGGMPRFLRLVAQDVAFSRRKHGFDSRRKYRIPPPL